jgi:hypothetical protein
METMLGRVLADKGRPDNIGDVGLLSWLIALAAPDRFDSFWVERNIPNALLQYRDAQEGKTTEMAWFLTGLSYAALKQLKGQEKVKDLAFQTYEVLNRNYEGKGIFRHMNKESFPGRIRGQVGSFADQVYPIYAFSKFGRAFNHQGALNIAGESASAICNLQGPFGQWWWHYDSRTGKVIGRYPVYSVHQDGMAPMALFAIGSANGKDYRGPIYKGLEWITGQNELGSNLIDEREAIIWRSFYQGNTRKYVEAALSLAALHLPARWLDGLMILQECRPYHLGWLLYAFADKV